MPLVRRFNVVARITAAQAIAAVNTDLIFNAVTTEGPGTALFAYDTATGIWTLAAGRTYRLRACPNFGLFTVATAGAVGFAWVDSANVILAANGGRAITYAMDQVIPASASPEATLIYRPTAATSVKIRVTALAGGPVDFAVSNVSGAGGYASVEEVG